MSPAKSVEGYVDFDIPSVKTPCRTWYRIVGDLSTSKQTPLVVVHGGPGLTHHYMLSLTDLNDRFGIPLIFYDQLGNGLSTHLSLEHGFDAWTEALFHAELTNLISKLGLSTYDLLGHSWGGMMGSTFAASQPLGLRKLVLANAAATSIAWDKAYALYRSQLPQRLRKVLERHEKAGTTASAEYLEVLALFNKKHFCRIVPYPKDCQTSFDWRLQNPSVTLAMHGPDKWSASGNLAVWTAVPLIKKIKVSTLILNGVEEGASDEAIAPFVEGIEDVKSIKLNASSHMPHWEERDNFMGMVGTWLSESHDHARAKL